MNSDPMDSFTEQGYNPVKDNFDTLRSIAEQELPSSR